MVAEIFVEFEGWSATQILAEADKICALLGKEAATCKLIVDAGGLPFAKCIAGKGNTTVCCEDIPTLHVCPSPSGKPSASPNECQVCQELGLIAELFVKQEGWNATTILAKADKLCELLGSEASMCKAIVNAGGMPLATCLANDENVTVCCQQIPDMHICGSSRAVASMQARFRKVGNVSDCQICKDFVLVAELFVKYEHWNASQILANAERICTLAGSLDSSCKTFIEAGGIALAECVATSQNSSECCNDIPNLIVCPQPRPVAAPKPVVAPQQQSKRIKMRRVD